MATKEQERKALEQIKKILSNLGEDSYISMAFEGCIEDAQTNIDNDWGCSMKQRYEQALRDNEKTVNQIAKVKREKAELEVKVEHLEGKIAELNKHYIPESLIIEIENAAQNRLNVLDKSLKQSADMMAAYAEHPQDIAFQSAVKSYRKDRDEVATHGYIIAELEKLR